MFLFYMLLFGRFVLCLSLWIYNEYHKLNFFGIEAQEAAVQITEDGVAKTGMNI